MKFTFINGKFLAKSNLAITFIVKQNYLIHLILCLYLAITIPLAAILNVWSDEVYSLNTTKNNIQYAINQAINFELQPPLYFALLNIWRTVNDSVFWARLFSIIAIAITIYIVDLLAKRFIKNINSIWFVAIFAFNPYVIRMAIEIRVYALLILLSALLLLLFFDGYLNPKYTIKARAIYLILAVFSLYTQYYLACLLIGNAVSLLVLRRWQALKYYLLGMTLVGLYISPIFFFVLKQVSKVSTHATFADGDFWQNFFVTKLDKVQVFLSNYTNSPKPILIICYLSIFLLFLGILSITNLKLITSNHLAIWTINITSIGFFFGVLIITNGLLLTRHKAGIFIVSCLGIFLLFSLIKYSRIRNGIIIFVSIISLLFYSYNLYEEYSSLAKAGDWKRVAAYIMNYEQPNQEILVFISIAAEELAYYYEGVNRIVPLPQAENFQNYSLQNYVLNNEAEITQSLASNHHDIWLVDNYQCGYLGVSYNCHVLEDFVNKNYQVTTTQKFYKSRVRFLQRK